MNNTVCCSTEYSLIQLVFSLVITSAHFLVLPALCTALASPSLLMLIGTLLLLNKIFSWLMLKTIWSWPSIIWLHMLSHHCAKITFKVGHRVWLDTQNRPKSLSLVMVNFRLLSFLSFPRPLIKCLPLTRSIILYLVPS